MNPTHSATLPRSILNHIKAYTSASNQPLLSKYQPLLYLYQYDTQVKYINSIIESVVKEIDAIPPNNIPIVTISPGILFSSKSCFKESHSHPLPSDRILQQYFNYAVSIQPCVLIIEDLCKIFPHESSARYQNNSQLYDTHTKVRRQRHHIYTC